MMLIVCVKYWKTDLPAMKNVWNLLRLSLRRPPPLLRRMTGSATRLKNIFIVFRTILFCMAFFLFYIFFACICMYACLKIIRYTLWWLYQPTHDPCTLKTNSKPLTCHQSLTYDQLVLTINLLFYARIVCILLTYCCTCALHFET